MKCRETWCNSFSEAAIPVDKNKLIREANPKLVGTRWLRINSRQTGKSETAFSFKNKIKLFMRSLLPQLRILSLSFARAILSSEDPSCDLSKAV